MSTNEQLDAAKAYATANLPALCKELQHMHNNGKVGPHMTHLQTLCPSIYMYPKILYAIETVHDAAVEYIAGL